MSNTARLIDTHVHLTDDRLAPDAERIVADLEKDGLESVITVGYDLPSSEGGYELAKAHENVYAAVGIHPHDSKFANGDMYVRFAEMAAHPKVVAMGEMGLDYYYDHSPRDTQKKVFAEQLELANSVGLPVILHVRDAYADTKDILTQNKHYLKNGLVLHCYSGSAEMVYDFGKFDSFFSFGGAITFANARHNLEALAVVPLSRLMLETDCPYMTPVPHRGKINVPAYVNLVADKAADVLGFKRERLIEITTKNAKTLFNRMK